MGAPHSTALGILDLRKPEVAAAVATVRPPAGMILDIVGHLAALPIAKRRRAALRLARAVNCAAARRRPGERIIAAGVPLAALDRAMRLTGA